MSIPQMLLAAIRLVYGTSGRNALQAISVTVIGKGKKDLPATITWVIWVKSAYVTVSRLDRSGPPEECGPG